MSLSEYMTSCLLDPEGGYYTTRDPFGAKGDFTTAPEISQMFGEMIGLFLAQVWLDQGRPDPFVLAELGPGRGTLMADALRALSSVPGARSAARVHLVEASPHLRLAQSLRVPEAHWHGDLSTLPEAPLFLVANEFFDALPIRQFRREPSGWAETQVGLDGGRLGFGLAPATDYAMIASRLTDTRPGDVVEVCPALPGLAAGIAARITRHGGVALILDYGGWHSLGNTLQALRGHQPCDPLQDPGQADLTAHVDFEQLAHAFRGAGAKPTAMTAQGVFLERLGITQRARRLAEGLTGKALANHVAAHRRLTHPDEMGTLFKVLACTTVDADLPPGLES